MKWELHTHTRESSLCGQVAAAEVAARHLEAGFAGIVITDHYNAYTLSAYPGDPLERTKAWLGGYRAAREAGEQLGLRVLFGAELRLTDSDNDYLLYGAEPDFLLEHPELYQLSLPALYALVKQKNGVLIQAHPNRFWCCQPENPAFLDGYEVYNGNARQENRNALSVALAIKNPALIYTSGSDYHRIEDVDTGSVETDRDIRTSADLVDCLRCGAFQRTLDDSEIRR